jgi:hypothetical protein
VCCIESFLFAWARLFSSALRSFLSALDFKILSLVESFGAGLGQRRLGGKRSSEWSSERLSAMQGVSGVLQGVLCALSRDGHPFSSSSSSQQSMVQATGP